MAGRGIVGSIKAIAAATAALVPRARSALVPLARYDAAGHGRRMRGWFAPSTGPNRAISGLSTLRNRARDAARNEWAGSSAAIVWGTQLIGVGIVARPNTKDPERKARFIRIWNAFCKTSDADGVLDFYGQQTLAAESWRGDGELFIRFRWRRADDGLVVPLQLQLLESDMLPLQDADVWPGMPAGNRMRQGIELDRIGRRVAYWFYREHPGDGAALGTNIAELVRVPASEVRHLYKPLRPGQLRGVPASAPVLPKLRSVGNFDDATLTRQELANLYAGFIKQPAPTGSPRLDPLNGEVAETDANGTPLVGLEPGIMQELAPGEDLVFSDPPDAGANYPDFMRQQHLGVSAGQGIPYETLTGDIRDISDRTLRVRLNDFRRTCEQYQWQILIPMLCQPAREACAQAAVLAGLLDRSEVDDFIDCTWSPHAWAYIHPTQDVQAKKMEREAGFKSRSQIIAERGDDPEAVDAERAEDMAREKRLGLAQEANSPGPTGAPRAQQ